MVDAVKLLTGFLKTIAEEQNYEGGEVTVKATSSGGANFTTDLYACTISAPNKPTLKLFGKVAGLSEELRQNSLEKYYRTEQLFYKDLVRHYDILQDKHNVAVDDRLGLPKFYGCIPNYMEETVVLEDLRDQGFIQYDRFTPITWDYSAKTVEELAKFHALSVAYGQEHPGEFKKLLEHCRFSIPAERENFRKLCKGWFDGALEVTKDEYKERFIKFMDTYGDMEETTQFYSSLRCPAIRHGDFKITNLLHKVCDDGKLQVRILDYQTIQSGAMVFDLIYFIFTGSDQQFRRKHFRQLIEHYYSHLRQALTRLGVDPDKVYPRADFDYEMKTVLPAGLTIAVYVLLVLMVKEEDAPKVSDDVDLTAFAMKPNALYGERLNGILEDYIEWGIL